MTKNLRLRLALRRTFRARNLSPALALPAVLVMCGGGSPKPPIAAWVVEAVNTVPGAELKLVDGKSWYVYYTGYTNQTNFNKCFGYLYDTYWHIYVVRAGKGAYVCSGNPAGVGKYVGDLT